MTDKEITKLLEVWEQAFWNWREDFYGDDLTTEQRRLDKNLTLLRGGLTSGNSSVPRIIRSFAKDYASRSWTGELEDVIVRFEKDNGMSYSESDKLDYSEYLTY